MKKLLVVLICIAFLPLASSAAEEQVWYTVKKGDFLYKVAEMYGTTVEELHRLNPKIKNVNLVYEGQKIRLIDRNEIEAKKKAAENKQTNNEKLNKDEILLGAQLIAEAIKLVDDRRCAENRCADNSTADNDKALAQAEEERKAAEEARRKAEKEYTSKYNQIYVAGKKIRKMTGDIDAMEVAPFGYGGGIEANFQITKYFAIMPMIDATYLSGSNKGIDAEAIGVSVKPYFLFQLGVEGNGFQPYFGIAPTYTLSIQDVYISPTENCNMMKNQVGIGAIAGVNYIYKNFVAGLAFEYNYILPYSKDESVLHMDLSTSYNIGLHLGYRF